ncbi:MAG: YggT family protein [Pseudomonadota bacterium]
MGAVFNILMLLLNVAQVFVIAHVIMSWLLTFGVLNGRQQFVAAIWSGLTSLLEPVYARLRRVLPNTGALDLAPLVALLGIIIAKYILIEIFF